MSTSNTTRPARTLLYLAFAIVYVVWGSTYMAIRVTVETLPPFLSGAARFLMAGGALLVLLRLRGALWPTALQWRRSLVAGLFMLVGGNGLVVWAEKSIASGFAALLVALTPIWFALLDWARPAGVRPQAKTILGVLVGFTGIVLLVNGEARVNGSRLATMAVIVAGMCWAGGSLYAKRAPGTDSPWMNAAMQMVCGGAGLLVVGVVSGEPLRTDWSAISARSLLALGYLIVFGSWIAFSAYVWLLQVSTPGRVSTYAYVNPMIAVFLGWALLGEQVTGRMLLGMLVIVAGVIIITIQPRLAPRLRPCAENAT
ncbi:MAG TPA: EamA family transporter [Candidatus Binatia bacterium]|nr:EamA family transporter [Candidatus Binatia bacterium]